MLDWGIQLLIDDRVDGVIFNLNGVLVATDPLHLACWKQAFDEVLGREKTRGFGARNPNPFGAEDYRLHVKGRPRYDGALALLRSRGSTLPYGSPLDPPGNDTVCAIANLKALRFRASLSLRPPQLTQGALELVTALRARQYRLGLVSSSETCEWMVRRLGLAELFPVRMDGALARDLGLAANPAPTALLETARRLQCPPQRMAVIDDSVIGVRAARSGRFGWVIGMDRGDDHALLRAAGADVVITSLDELQPSVDLALTPPEAASLQLPAE